MEDESHQRESAPNIPPPRKPPAGGAVAGEAEPDPEPSRPSPAIRLPMLPAGTRIDPIPMESHRPQIVRAPPRWPGVLIAFSAFAVVVTIADIVLLVAPSPFRASVIPHTGWLISGTYPFMLFFVFSIMFLRWRRGPLRLAITSLLLLQIASGVLAISQADRPNFGNPYLTVGRWRAMWTIVVPGIWILLLYTPAMNRFCGHSQKSIWSRESQPRARDSA